MIAFPVNFASKNPLSISFVVLVSTTINFGGAVYPDPPSEIVTTPIVLEFLTVINGDICAFGCNVLSDEYSNPSLRILTSLTCPIVVDVGIIFGTINASVAIVEPAPTKIGTSLYPLPPEIILILSINPFAVLDVVEYFNELHSVFK